MKTNSFLKVTSSLVALLFSVSSLLAQENKENVNREITQDSLLRIARTII